MEFKKCSKCGHTFPATSEFFYRDPGHRDGLRSWCKACVLAKRRIYREAHKKEIAAANRVWKQRNRERRAAYNRQRFRANPTLRISNTISGRMWDALRNKKAGCHWESLVGYTLDDLVRHLEARFQPGMSWDNYGKYGWHIDHIKPRCAFTYTSPDDPEFKECWALSNLQPLWVTDNLSKGAQESALLATDQPLRRRRAG